ncbi:MAG: ABC transporter ATP-binding protein [Proteobacteria bacterium]|nr:ABC transporter ATP-binding protein [Pseudomonadota bacterium]
MEDNYIDIKHLSFAYDQRRPILKDISLTIPRRKVVAVMGGSGSGKTTLLRNICGQEKPQKNCGAIRVMGRDMMNIGRNDLYELRKKIGMLFQFGGLFSDMSVFDNVAFPLREHTQLSPEVINDIVLLKLQAVGLRGSAKLYPSELSGGMARRVALARAVVMDPQLILYDEPFAGLDPISLAITARLIRELNDALNATSIIVTHDIAESFQIVDYVYLMWQGDIVAQGTPAEMENSSLPYVRQFVDAKTDGPLPFHQPALPLGEEFQIGTALPHRNF